MFCQNCGSGLTQGDTICKACGHKILQGNSEPKNKINKPHNPQTKYRTRPKRKRKPILIWTTILIICLAIICGLFLFFRNGTLTIRINPFSKTEHKIDLNSDLNPFSKTNSNFDLKISQIDNSHFPDMVMYAQIKNTDGSDAKDISKNTFNVNEIGHDGKEYKATISEILPLKEEDSMNINLVIDQSGSMQDDNKIQNAKSSATQFVNEILSRQNNQVEITSFDDYVYNKQPFTSNKTSATNAINNITTTGQTALYDALYDALIQTHQQKGSRFIIAFTDGAENASLHTEDEVISLSKTTGIPVYIIGIGSSTDYSPVSALASSCNGQYYNAQTVNLSQVLLNIYDEIYSNQRQMYKICYTSSSTADEKEYRTVSLTNADNTSNVTSLSYVPKDNIARIDNAKLLSIIDTASTADNTAVALVDLKTNLEYRVGNARRSYVASGFYAPIDIVASGIDQGKADLMMTKMDNNAGNYLIDKFGGLSRITDALHRKGYTQTNFERYFGDVKNSNRGYENYTSAVDAAKILRDIYESNRYQLMQWDLTKDGISLPSDAKVYAHRGQGIGSAYNVFAIIESPKTTYGLAIMISTDHLSDSEIKRQITPMVSNLIAEIHQEMESSYQ